MSTLEQLAERFNTVIAHWHDAYAEWFVYADPQRSTQEDCRFIGAGFTLDEAIADCLKAADNTPDTQSSQPD